MSKRRNKIEGAGNKKKKWKMENGKWKNQEKGDLPSMVVELISSETKENIIQ